MKRQATSSLLKFDGVDLIERRVPGAAEVGGVVRPVAAFGRGLARRLPREAGPEPDEGGENQHERRSDTKESSGHRSTPFGLLGSSGMLRRSLRSPWANRPEGSKVMSRKLRRDVMRRIPGALALALSVVVAHGFITARRGGRPAAAVGLRLHVRAAGRPPPRRRPRPRPRQRRPRRTRRRGSCPAARSPSRWPQIRDGFGPADWFPAITRRCPRSSRTASGPTCAPARSATTRTARAVRRTPASPACRSPTSSRR